MDSRGLNRALNGDVAGAIQDFQQYADDQAKPLDIRKIRREWIAKLDTGSSPFDADLINKLVDRNIYKIPLLASVV